MTTTTKIFVILVCLFAFIFTPMAVLFASRVENYRALYENYRDAAATANAAAANAKALAQAEKANSLKMLEAERARVLERDQQIAELQRKLDEVTAQRDAMARSRDMLETQASVLTAEVAVKSKHNQELAEAKEKALARERELQATNAWLTDQLQLRRAEVDVLKQQLNQRQQELVSFREENDQLRKQLNLGKAEPLTAVPSGNIESGSAPARSPITGKVTQVRGNLASIDVGESSGVRPGMRMVVTRGASYIADIVVRDVNPSEAVGEITTSKGQLRQGDLVIDEATFNQG